MSCNKCNCAATSCTNCINISECMTPITCCCDAAHQMWRQIALRKGILLEYFALTWLTVEIVVSIYAGFIAGSFALLAFGGDSLIELASALVVLHHLRKDSEGFDVNTEKVEKFVSMLLFLLIPVIGVWRIILLFSRFKGRSFPFGNCNRNRSCNNNVISMA